MSRAVFAIAANPRVPRDICGARSVTFPSPRCPHASFLLAHRNRNSVVPKSRNLTIRFGAKGGGGKKSSNGANPFASSDLMALRNKLPSNPDLGQTKKQTGGNDDMVRVSEADVVAAFSAKNKGGSMKAERKGKGGKKSKNETKKPGQIGSGNGSSLGVDPAQQAVRVGVTRAGKKGKTVTVVDGLDVGSADEQKELLKKFKKIIGAGGSVSENGSFSFQGDNAALLVDMLKAMGFKQARQTGGLGVK